MILPPPPIPARMSVETCQWQTAEEREQREQREKRQQSHPRQLALAASEAPSAAGR